MDFDVLIVGAGPAGTAAAYRLRQNGLSVLLLDRPNHPAHKPCAGGLTIKTLNLMSCSVAPVIERVVTGLTIGVQHDRGERLEHFGHADAICAFSVRSRFDALNFEHALQAGAEFSTAPAIERIEQRAASVVTSVGSRTITSRYLIGADGANSVVRRLISDERWFSRGFAIEGIVPYAAIGAEPPMELLFNFVSGGYGWLFPKGDHVNVGIYTSSDSVALSKQRLLDYARRRLGSDKVDDIKGFPLGFGGAGYSPCHEHIVLAGDAGGFAEPLLGEGIHNAIKTGQAAADAVVDAERGGAPSFSAAYRQRTRPVRKDLARCDTLARHVLYPHLKLVEARMMHRGSIRRAFLRGFAAGQTMREITGRFLFPPRYQPAAPLSLRQFLAAKPAQFSGLHVG